MFALFLSCGLTYAWGHGVPAESDTLPKDDRSRLDGLFPDANVFRPADASKQVPIIAPEQRLMSMCFSPPADAAASAAAAANTHANTATWNYWLTDLWGGFNGHIDLADLYAADVRTMQLHRCIMRQPIKKVLDAVWVNGLSVIIELPIHHYITASGGCYRQDFDCYDTVRFLYHQILKTDIVEDSTYHPAIEMVMLAVEPDLAFEQYCADATTSCEPHSLYRALLSAWDGLLDAEQEAGVNGSIKISTLLAIAGRSMDDSKSVCFNLRAPQGCSGTESLRQLWFHVTSQGNQSRWSAHNNLSASYAMRWVSTFHNTVPTKEVLQTLKDYYSFISPVQTLPAVVMQLNSSSWASK